MKIEESLNMTFNETPTSSKTSTLVDDDLDEVEEIKELVPQPKNLTIIGTKLVFRNKLDENGVVSRNKARLVAQGYNKQEGIDYYETYAPVARLESIRILLAYAYALDFKLFQMDVKSAFLNGFINEEVYVSQPLGFIDFEKPDHVYKLKKALYGLKQAPKAEESIIVAEQGFAIVISPDDDASELGSGAKMLTKGPLSAGAKDLLQKNAQLQHHDVQKKIDDPKMMVNNCPRVHLDQRRWIPMDRLD
ncbi:retrovirus-related pol polyprotein from transposon TNT 1-94 [Tanacetum coccineum]